MALVAILTGIEMFIIIALDGHKGYPYISFVHFRHDHHSGTEKYYFQYLPRLKLLVRNEKEWKNMKNNSKKGINNQKLVSLRRIIVRL